MVEATENPAQTLSDAYDVLQKAMAEDDYAKVDESATQILALDASEKTDGAKHAKLVSMVKQRQFTEATKYLNKHEYTRKQCIVEAAYILHRQNQNKQALQMLEKVPEDLK